MIGMDIEAVNLGDPAGVCQFNVRALVVTGCDSIRTKRGAWQLGCRGLGRWSNRRVGRVRSIGRLRWGRCERVPCWFAALQRDKSDRVRIRGRTLSAKAVMEILSLISQH
jgi:hypothetical protein